MEYEHLRNKVKHLEAVCQRLTTSFDTAKYEAETMFQKLSQVEGNNTRLRHITQLCQRACEVHELLYEMKFFPSTTSSPPGHTFPSFSDNDFSSLPTPSDPRGGDTGTNKSVLVRARYILSDLESNEELRPFVPPLVTEGDGKFPSLSSWNLSMSQCTGTASVFSSGVSSMGGEIELNNTEMDQLKMYYQGLVSYTSHLMSRLVEVDGLAGLKTLKDPVVIKDCVLDTSKIQQAVADMEEYVDTEELCKIREEKAELRVSIHQYVF